MTRIELQRWWLRIHRWIGLALIPVFFALAVTGAVLVFPDFFDRLANADRYPPAVRPTQAEASTLLREGGAHLPAGDWVSAIRYPDAPGGAVMVAGQVSGPPNLGLGPARRAKVWLDPFDGSLLSTADGRADFLWSMHAIHGHLLLAGSGREWLAWVGGILLVSAISGIWIWWPGLRQVRRALRWQKRASISLNLHRQSGAIIVVVLLLETLTGIYIAIPAAFAAMIEPGTAQLRQPGEGPSAARSLREPRLAIDEVLSRARALVPEGKIRSVFLPTDKLAAWTVNIDRDGPRAVRIAEADGATRLQPAARPGRAARVESVMVDLHYGHYGWFWRGVIFLSGVVMALLACTGPLIWWQGRKRRRKHAANG